MTKSYVVQWKYKSGLGGPWMEGDVVQLDDPVAEAINNDSPGVLKREKTSGQPKHDRQMKSPEQVRDQFQGGKNDQGAITKEGFQAVRKEGD